MEPPGQAGRRDDPARPEIDPGEDLTAAVHRMLQGDDEAFRVVYRTVQPSLLRYVTVLVGSGDAEDVASETWSQAVRDLHRFSGDGAGFRGWLSTIGRHRALDHLRAKGRRPVVDTPLEDLLEPGDDRDAERGALESLSTQAALSLIGSLPPEQAEAVLLRAVMGLDAKSAGEVLGKRPGAVRTAAYRGLRTLAARLDPTADPFGDGRGRDAAAGDDSRARDAEGVT
ncbi:MAG: RNA polymerase sigma factor [Mycobacteriales bacterium]